LTTLKTGALLPVTFNKRRLATYLGRVKKNCQLTINAQGNADQKRVFLKL